MAPHGPAQGCMRQRRWTGASPLPVSRPAEAAGGVLRAASPAPADGNKRSECAVVGRGRSAPPIRSGDAVREAPLADVVDPPGGRASIPPARRSTHGAPESVRERQPAKHPAISSPSGHVPGRRLRLGPQHRRRPRGRRQHACDDAWSLERGAPVVECRRRLHRDRRRPRVAGLASPAWQRLAGWAPGVSGRPARARARARAQAIPR